MYRLLEHQKDTILETDEYLSLEQRDWLPCKGDPNCNHTYTRFMLPIRRKVECIDFKYYRNVVKNLPDFQIKELRQEFNDLIDEAKKVLGTD